MVALKTPSEVRAEFRRMGITVKAWALANGLSPAVVHQALKGSRPCVRGELHRAAVLLGLKAGVLPPKNLSELRFDLPQE